MNVTTDLCLLEVRGLVFDTLILACDHWVWGLGEHRHGILNLLDIAGCATSCWLRASFSTNVPWVLGCQCSVGLVKELWPLCQLEQLQIIFLSVLFLLLSSHLTIYFRYIF